MNNLYHISSLLLLLFAVNSTCAQTITTIAGGGTSAADGVPATTARFVQPQSAEQSFHGDVHVTSGYFYGSRVVKQNSLIYNFAGNGALGYSGDGGLAT
ncbi:MAG: hypothetical protein JNM41_11105, partial [Flavipsychrobacter sp.]|nr:hypothetical protein [Flavipsychrobacter sp.]